MRESVPAEYFVDLYKREIDPWNFRTSSYEREKYQATLDALPRERYMGALEIGCSIGVFTEMLALRCDRVLAVDVSPDALERAQAACARFAHIEFRLCAVPREYPQERFDLTTICEVGYYLNGSDLRLLRRNVANHSNRGATVVLVHWTPHVDGHASTAEEVHDIFRRAREMRWLNGYAAPTYRLDVLERR